MSARVIAGAVALERFQGGDDLVQAGLDAAQVLGQALLAVGVGLGDEVRLVAACRRWICRNTGVVWKSGQVRQALGCGQSCWAGRAQ